MTPQQKVLLCRGQHPETTLDTSLSAEEAVNKCIRCGRALKDPESIKNSLGPICRRKFSLEQPPLPLKLSSYRQRETEGGTES